MFFIMESTLRHVAKTYTDQTGESNPNWKDEPGYFGGHHRVYRSRGKANHCENGEHDGPFEWENLTGNHSDPNDYKSLCIPCHRAMDAGRADRFTCKNDHELTEDNMYVYDRADGSINRMCKRCQKDRSKRNRQNG